MLIGMKEYDIRSLEKSIAALWGGYKATKDKVTFMKGGKKITRVVQENKRGTKAVKYENIMVSLKKLKLV